jgi:hypothetical protein
MSIQSPSEALKSGLPMPARRCGVSARRHVRLCNYQVYLFFSMSITLKRNLETRLIDTCPALIHYRVGGVHSKIVKYEPQVRMGIPVQT